MIGSAYIATGGGPCLTVLLALAILQLSCNVVQIGSDDSAHFPSKGSGITPADWPPPHRLTLPPRPATPLVLAEECKKFDSLDFIVYCCFAPHVEREAWCTQEINDKCCYYFIRVIFDPPWVDPYKPTFGSSVTNRPSGSNRSDGSARALAKRGLVEDAADCVNQFIINLTQFKLVIPRICCKLPIIGALPACSSGKSLQIGEEAE